MEYKPILPEQNDNVSHDQPFREFIYLFSGISIFLLISFWALGFFVDRAVNFISPEMEARIFSLMAPSGSELKNDGDLQQAELQRMVDGLQRCIRISYPLKVYLVDSDDANALAFPGGSIVVLKGLLGKVTSENGLSFVLAHELAHFKNRDHLRGMGRAIVFTAAAAFITGGDSNLTQLFAPTSGFSQARYSQEREEMADLQALKILGCYYGHGGGATEFFEAMEYHDRGKSKLLGHYFDSHPEALQRIDNLHRLAGELNLTFENPLPLPDVLKPSAYNQ